MSLSKVPSHAQARLFPDFPLTTGPVGFSVTAPPFTLPSEDSLPRAAATLAALSANKCFHNAVSIKVPEGHQAP